MVCDSSGSVGGSHYGCFMGGVLFVMVSISTLESLEHPLLTYVNLVEYPASTDWWTGECRRRHLFAKEVASPTITIVRHRVRTTNLPQIHTVHGDLPSTS